mmetsp:Transcript_408/g.706  ORF Transcript_408/g.706 Transcript_408/m.706 type:complete len:143 (-) Transcript_408:16-444(-)
MARNAIATPMCRSCISSSPMSTADQSHGPKIESSETGDESGTKNTLEFEQRKGSCSLMWVAELRIEITEAIADIAVEKIDGSLISLGDDSKCMNRSQKKKTRSGCQRFGLDCRTVPDSGAPDRNDDIEPTLALFVEVPPSRW